MYKIIFDTKAMATRYTVTSEAVVLKLHNLIGLYGFSYEGRRYTKYAYNKRIMEDNFSIYKAIEACRSDNAIKN
jgi:hypothetical protein